MSARPSLLSSVRRVRVARHFIRRSGAAVGVLSLGIGMSVAMFSLVDAVLVRPLPFPEQDDIYVIWKADPLAGAHMEELAYPELRDLQTGLDVLSYAAVMPTSLYGYAKVLQAGTSDPVQIESMPVSHDFFRVLGVSPALGRDFTGSDERVGAAPVVIVSDEVWRTHLDADERIVGSTIRLSGEHHTVIGVMGPGVEFPRGAGLWVPLGVREFIVENRETTFLQAIVRTPPHVSSDRLSRSADSLFGRLAAEHPEAYSASQRGVVTPLVEYWTGSATVHLWTMLAASVLLLIASIVSASHLLLTSILSRRAEFATRLALGAHPRQVVADLLVEGALVAAAAVALGAMLASGVLRILTRMAVDIPRLTDAALDFRSLCFAAGLAALVAMACALTSGLLVTRIAVGSALRDAGGRTSVSRRTERVRWLFVATQAATTVGLLTLAVLLVQSYRSLMGAESGFANRDAVSMNLQLRGPNVLSGRAFTTEYRRSFYRRLLDRVRDSPGVTSAAAILLRPLEGSVGWDVPYEFEFESGGPDRVLPKANYEVITPGYFETVGTPLLEGRDFSERDTERTPPVMIVSRPLAERIRASGHSPLGHRLRLGVSPVRWHTVVGVAAAARYRGITQSGADMFVPYTQAHQPTHYVVARGEQPPSDLADMVRRTLAELDSNQAVAHVATIGELVERSVARHRFNMLLLLCFAACATILAAASVYSIIAEAAAARKSELAIRAALGAQRGRLVRDMIMRTIVFVALGEIAGLLIAASIGVAASDLLYGVSARDPAILTTVAMFVFVVSAMAATFPAWTAATKGHTVLRRA